MCSVPLRKCVNPSQAAISCFYKASLLTLSVSCSWMTSSWKWQARRHRIRKKMCRIWFTGSHSCEWIFQVWDVKCILIFLQKEYSFWSVFVIIFQVKVYCSYRGQGQAEMLLSKGITIIFSEGKSRKLPKKQQWETQTWVKVKVAIKGFICKSVGMSSGKKRLRIALEISVHYVSHNETKNVQYPRNAFWKNG